mgnify:CR=1 FL=1
MADSKVIPEPVANKTCVVVGTRPGIIKMSPIIAELETRDAPSFTLHAGQHYSHELDDKIFEDLGLDRPKYHLEDVRDAEFHGEQTATMLTGIERVLLEERPEHVLVCGDANFNLAGALAARKLRLTVSHVEAGLRSDDWRMPEEHNRVIIDHISDYLFTPTEVAKRNAIEDNVKGAVHVTGNTIVDAVQRNIGHAQSESEVLDDLSLSAGQYVVFTAHREENVDDPDTLAELLSVLELLDTELGLPVVYPIHPRTVKRLEQFDLSDRLESIDCLELLDPLGYLDFLALLSNAAVTLTDSGGIQEEACITGVPCVTLRENTERPETVEVGANVIAGTDPSVVLEHTSAAIQRESDWSNPFGDGNTAVRIVDTILGTSEKSSHG